MTDETQSKPYTTDTPEETAYINAVLEFGLTEGAGDDKERVLANRAATAARSGKYALAALLEDARTNIAGEQAPHHTFDRYLRAASESPSPTYEFQCQGPGDCVGHTPPIYVDTLDEVLDVAKDLIDDHSDDEEWYLPDIGHKVSKIKEDRELMDDLKR